LNQICGHEEELKIELRKSGQYVLCTYTTEELLSHSTKVNGVNNQSVNLVMKETLDQFQGKEYVRHIISPSGTESWLTDDRSFIKEANDIGASKINTVENDKKHVLFLFNNSNIEVGRYYMGKKLQGQTPEQIEEQKLNLTIFDSWNPATKQWVPCISTNQ
jgi:hypothetical protein